VLAAATALTPWSAREEIAFCRARGSSVLARNVRPVADGLVQARGLTKRFGRVEAVRGIDLDVGRGEVFGFLGPNGAGKSSAMRMIACVSPRTSGDLQVLGLDPERDGPAVRARIGVVPQLDNLDTELTVRQNLQMYGRYFGLSRAAARAKAAELLEFAQLTERAEDEVDPLSGGMKRRLTIARALVNEPELLLLDEPTTGLDPQARHLLWDRLYRLKREGVTQIITTHYMDEAEQLCDRLVVMDGGVIVAEGGPQELIAAHSTREVLELRFEPEHRPAAAELEPLVDRVEELPDRLLLYTGDGERAKAAVLERGHRPAAVLVRRSSLEDVFLRLTGRTLVD
jgi:lipooligosaccharide transport system ATP-binding protein